MISAMCFSTSTIETAPRSDTSDKRPRQHFNGGRVTGPQEFMEFVNESGRGDDTKIWSHSTHRWFS